MDEKPADLIEQAVARFIGSAALVNDDAAECAGAVLEALAAAGYVIVPREPTEAMLEAGALTEDLDIGFAEQGANLWRAMIAAAPGQAIV